MKKIIALIAGTSSLCVSAVQIDETKLRNDIYPLPIDKIYHVEGWVEQNQFFPRYFKLSGTIQVSVFNDSKTPLTISNIVFDGKPINEVTTRPDFAGPVIWHCMTPESIAPGAYGHLTIRLRNKLEKPVKIGIEGVFTTITPESAEKLRILYVAFNKDRNKLTVFVESLQNSGKLKSISIDGKMVKAEIANSDFTNGNPAVALVELERPLDFGSFFIIKVDTEKASTFDQVRTRCDRMLTGMIGSNFKSYIDAGFNLNYWLHGAKGHSYKGLTNLSPVSDEASLKSIATSVPPEQYIYGNSDEPDAHEPEGLPYMERCGVNIMQSTLPAVSKQRRLDPVHPTGIMIDSTYAPLNWYVYGAVSDIPFHDCYVPTRFHGLDSEQIAREASILLSAVAPRAPQMMLWAVINTGFMSTSLQKRATTPLENELQYYYALGSGIKGVHYFNDLETFPRMSGGGYYIGCSRIASLWRSIARGNALIDRMQELLNNAYPWKAVESSNPDLWCSSLLSRHDTLIITAVNRNVKVSWMDLMWFLHTKTATSSVIEVTLPNWFKEAKLLRVDWDKVTEIPLLRNGNKAQIPIQELPGGRMFVISTDKDIEKRLAGTEKIQKSVAEIQKIPVQARGKIIAAKAIDKTNVLKFKHDENEIVLDFGKEETLKSIAKISLDNAELDAYPDGLWRMIPGKAIREARAEMVFFIETDEKSITAELRGETIPSYNSSLQLSARATNAPRYTTDSSIKVLWFEGKSLNESLLVTAKSDKSILYEIRVILKDPIIWEPDGSTTAVKKLAIRKGLANVDKPGK